MENFSALLATGEFPSQRPVMRSYDVSFDLRLEYNREAADLRHHRAHYDVIVIISVIFYIWNTN